MLAVTLIILSLFGAGVVCKVYENVVELPGLQYDFVIVGGGTAGNVVANRLTEDPKVSVLVLEAGVSNQGVLPSEVPFLLGELFGANVYNWTHLLGGCSAHNGMVYTRGAADDFNRYARLTGDKGWSWDRLLPYFRKSEKLTPPADIHDTQGQIDPYFHGTDGPISVSLTGFPWPVFDHHGNHWASDGRRILSIDRGKRSTSATGYLAPKFIKRPNLHVLVHAQVSKLVNATKKSGKPRFGGVEFRFGTSLFVARASKEIILSAGAVGTPQILLNSGIGAHAALSALGISTVLDLPSVGQNASDHVFLSLSWAVNSTQTLESITQNTTRFAEAMEQWNDSRTGPFVDAGVATHTAWLRLATDSPALAPYADPSPGPDAPHIEFLLNVGGAFGSGPGNFMSIGVAAVSPVSRGSVTLNSSDPFAPPLIDTGLLTSEFDILALKEGIKLAQRFVSAPVWCGYLGEPTVDLTGDLETTIRANAAPSYHLVGTAAMSARGAPYGVVNPDLRVKGMEGLSVIDTSVLPIVPAAHTQAAAYVVAERGADLVKERWT
ncbi:pyranose dehydrogenase [Mycena latifolia]|nr:pyranose dehydrogenase [Mycena latifolia]